MSTPKVGDRVHVEFDGTVMMVNDSRRSLDIKPDNDTGGHRPCRSSSRRSHVRSCSCDRCCDRASCVVTGRVQSLNDYSRNVHCDRDFIEIGGYPDPQVSLAERAAATVRAAIHDRVESNRQTADRALGWDKARRGRHRAGAR